MEKDLKKVKASKDEICSECGEKTGSKALMSKKGLEVFCSLDCANLFLK